MSDLNEKDMERLGTILKKYYQTSANLCEQCISDELFKSKATEFSAFAKNRMLKEGTGSGILQFISIVKNKLCFAIEAMPGLDNNRFTILERLGASLVDECDMLGAVLLTSEVWIKKLNIPPDLSEEERKNYMLDKPVRDYEDKQECLMITAATFDGRKSVQLYDIQRAVPEDFNSPVKGLTLRNLDGLASDSMEDNLTGSILKGFILQKAKNMLLEAFKSE